ncbi:MAG: alanine--tRNA ligase-related protein, partial [Candidatus Magasanikbacteria bacterium]
KFRNTLEQGIKQFSHLTKSADLTIVSAKDAFDLYQSFGFPVEMTMELAQENGMIVDIAGFSDEMKNHQDLSRAGAEQKFKGGLADHGEVSVKYHTATHLLHAALRSVLGDHVQQRGSNINAERLRFDFSHPEKMTDEQKKRVEELVNNAIIHDYPITFAEMSVVDAKTLGAMGLFEDKYGTKVKVYSVGDPLIIPSATNNSLTFSKEICGGPHIERTGLLGKFRIIKEEAVSAGVRRIKAVLQ